jgi:Beta-lactamase superfamily domain
MRVLVLGSAAGGGFPQWNSNADSCRLARTGGARALPRNQASAAVGADGRSWFLLNASPNLRQRIEANTALHPISALRSSPIAGLLRLPECRKLFTILATARVHAILASNMTFDVVADGVVRRRIVAPDTNASLPLPDGRPSGLRLESFAVPGNVPREPGDGGGRADHRRHALRRRQADGLHSRLRRFAPNVCTSPTWCCSTARCFHINNSNPILVDDSSERAAAEAAGWQIAFDGMEFTL